VAVFIKGFQNPKEAERVLGNFDTRDRIILEVVDPKESQAKVSVNKIVQTLFGERVKWEDWGRIEVIPNPQEFNTELTFTNSVAITPFNVYVDSGGITGGTITLSGKVPVQARGILELGQVLQFITGLSSIGWGGDAYRIIKAMSLITPDLLKITGFAQIVKLIGVLAKFSQELKEGKPVRLKFRNTRFQVAYWVIPERVSITQSSANPLTFSYSLALVILGSAEERIEKLKIKPLDVLKVVLGVGSVIRSAISILGQFVSLRGITSQVLSLSELLPKVSSSLKGLWLKILREWEDFTDALGKLVGSFSSEEVKEILVRGESKFIEGRIRSMSDRVEEDRKMKEGLAGSYKVVSDFVKVAGGEERIEVLREGIKRAQSVSSPEMSVIIQTVMLSASEGERMIARGRVKDEEREAFGIRVEKAKSVFPSPLTLRSPEGGDIEIPKVERSEREKEIDRELMSAVQSDPRIIGATRYGDFRAGYAIKEEEGSERTKREPVAIDFMLREGQVVLRRIEDKYDFDIEEGMYVVRERIKDFFGTERNTYILTPDFGVALGDTIDDVIDRLKATFDFIDMIVVRGRKMREDGWEAEIEVRTKKGEVVVV